MKLLHVGQFFDKEGMFDASGPHDEVESLDLCLEQGAYYKKAD